jgi:hypothetical protein
MHTSKKIYERSDKVITLAWFGQVEKCYDSPSQVAKHQGLIASFGQYVFLVYLLLK